MRQREAIKPHQQRNCSRKLQRLRRCFKTKRAYKHAGNNPPGSSKHTDRAKLSFGVLHLSER